jgi:hypothetical protein
VPSEREFGELVGAVKALGREIREMRAANSDDHASVASRLDQIDVKLDRKVDREWMAEQDLPQRVDKLESSRDKISGGRAVFAGMGGALLTIVGFLIGGH